MLVLYWLNRRSDTNTFHLESLLTSLMGLEHLSMQSYSFFPLPFHSEVQDQASESTQAGSLLGPQIGS